MISENIQIINESFSKYYADQKYLILFFVALIFIVIFEENKENKAFLFYYPIVLFVIVLNPLSAFLLFKFVTANVYYRSFWTVPFGIVIAYFGAELISRANKTSRKVIGTIAFILLIIYCGSFVYTNQVFRKVNNWYKLPDEYIEITQILSEIHVNDKKAMVPTNLVGYVRQYDASIKLAYQRRPYEDYDFISIVKYYNSGDVENLVKLCKEQNVNIIVYDNSIPLTISPSYYGYALYKQIPQYDIYVLTEDLLSDIKIVEEKIEIEGIKNNYKLCFVNDLHIIVPYDDVSDENRETVKQRYDELFKTTIGERSSKLWSRIPEKINEQKSDLVIFGGDMVDYASSSNIECLKNGMREIKQEIIYIRADHDYGTHYNNELDKEYVNNLEKSIDGNLDVYCKDLGEILVVGIDNSTNQISDEAFAKLKEIFAIGKPIILVTHVPLNSRIDNSLAEASKESWGGRNLTWDEVGTTYTANDNTREFLNLVYDENSPVKAVLAAHLHFKNTSMLNQNITQYVFDATYKGSIGVINIVGK